MTEYPKCNALTGGQMVQRYTSDTPHLEGGVLCDGTLVPLSKTYMGGGETRAMVYGMWKCTKCGRVVE